MKTPVRVADLARPPIWNCTQQKGCGAHGTVPLNLTDWQPSDTLPAISARGACPVCRGTWEVRPDFSGGYGEPNP